MEKRGSSSNQFLMMFLLVASPLREVFGSAMSVGEWSGRKKRSLFQFICDAFEAIFQPALTEVDQKSEMAIQEPHVRQDLFCVDGAEGLDGFELDDDFVFDDQIGAKAFVEDNAIILDWNRNLTFDIQPHALQFAGKNDLVDSFQKARSEIPMNLKCGVHHKLGYFVSCHDVFFSRAGKDSRYGARRKDCPHAIFFFSFCFSLRRCGVA